MLLIALINLDHNHHSRLHLEINYEHFNTIQVLKENILIQMEIVDEFN